MSHISRLWRLKFAPTEFNPTENQHEGWKRKSKQRNRRLRKQK